MCQRLTKLCHLYLKMWGTLFMHNIKILIVDQTVNKKINVCAVKLISQFIMVRLKFRLKSLLG